ncbi:MAG: flagellar biosynthesis protein FlhB [Aestuariivirga sp.]|uniref:flagellar type III secretion system protein FlhB n=1 Tax=Aestuariivirga sp. TaxID=2650926 RepID=UPI0025C392D7|nr:flagellar type III secretion system protein FlhB [Aestuariivirga sp.]MCA3561418.1 flagellar biosynthesis protein FlhB [Aestuariivirga sp.]
MAEEADRDSKTEDATEKRISDAIDKGNVPMAREATLFGSIAASLGALLLLGGWMLSHLTEALQTALAAAGSMRIDDREAAASHLVSLLRDAGLPLLPVLAFIAAGSILASLLQNVPSAAGDRVSPKPSRISPLAGWNRLFGRAGLVEFLKAAVKLAAVSVILWLLFRRDLPQFVTALAMDPALLPDLLRDLAAGALRPLLGLALLLAIADVVWSRYRWRRDLRMTKEQVKEEMKEAEGDPFIKVRIRGLARQRTSRRMLEKLPEASVVITNPTHYAVALRYRREEGGAPVVVAKGVDHMARTIREIATAHEVPLIENRPLARSLYDQVEIDAQIPPEFYRAVAEIIHYLNSTGRLPRHTMGR